MQCHLAMLRMDAWDRAMTMWLLDVQALFLDALWWYLVVCAVIGAVALWTSRDGD